MGRPEPNPASPGCRITKAGSVFAALTPSVSSVTPRPVSDEARLLSQPLTFQGASHRSISLGLCFSFVVSLALRPAWGL